MTTRSRSPRYQRHRRYTAMVALLAVLTQYATVLPIFRSELADYLNISLARFGLLLGIGPLIGGASVLVSGMLIDRLGCVCVIRWSLRFTAAGFLLIAVGGQSFAIMLAAKILIGASFSPLFMSMQVYIPRLFPRDSRRMLAYGLAFMSAGGIVIPLLAEGLLSLSTVVGFAVVLHLPFLLCALVLLAGSFFYRQKARSLRTPRPTASAPRQWRLPAISLRPALLTCMASLHGIADTTLILWMPIFLTSVCFAHHPLVPGVVIAAYATAYLLARSLLASLPDSLGRHAMLYLPGLIGGSLLVLGLVSRSFWLTVAGYVFGAFCWSSTYPTVVAALTRQVRRRRGAALACIGVLTATGSGGLITLLGWVTEQIGEERMWLAMLIPASLFLAVGLMGLLWINLGEKLQPEDDFNGSDDTPGQPPIPVAGSTQQMVMIYNSSNNDWLPNASGAIGPGTYTNYARVLYEDGHSLPVYTPGWHPNTLVTEAAKNSILFCPSARRRFDGRRPILGLAYMFSNLGGWRDVGHAAAPPSGWSRERQVWNNGLTNIASFDGSARTYQAPVFPELPLLEARVYAARHLYPQ